MIIINQNTIVCKGKYLSLPLPDLFFVLSDDGTAESRRIVFFGRSTLLGPRRHFLPVGCFTAVMTARPRGRDREGLRIKARDDGGGVKEAARAARRDAVSSAGENMFVQEGDGNRGKEFRRCRLVKSSDGAAAGRRSAVPEGLPSFLAADGWILVKPPRPRSFHWI